MKFTNIKRELDLFLGPFNEDTKKTILLAAQKDFELLTRTSTKCNPEAIIEIFNNVFDKKSRVISKKVINKYKDILKHFSMEEIEVAMKNAKEDSFHKELEYKYCTIEYFSRIEQIDKWINVKKDKSKDAFPKFNVKENV